MHQQRKFIIQVLRCFVLVRRWCIYIDRQSKPVLAICTDSLEGIGTEEIQYCSGEQELFYLVRFWTVSSPNWPFFWSLTESKSKLTVVLADNRGSGLSSLGKMRTKCPQPRSVKRWSVKVGETLPLAKGAGGKGKA